MFKRASVFALSLLGLLALPAFAQVQQSGSVTPGHAAKWIANGVIQDAGTATNGGLNTLGVTSSSACGFGINNLSITSPTGYNQLCLGFNGSYGVLSLNGFGGSSPTALQINVNGTNYQIGGNDWLSALIDSQFGSTQGSILYRGASAWAALNPGSAGQALVSGGAGANPAWGSTPGLGTVTSITAGSGLSGGTITTSGTISLAAPVTVPLGGTGQTTLSANAVLLGNGTSAITSSAPGSAGTCLISNGVGVAPTFQSCTGAGTVTSIATGAGLTGGPITSSGTVAVATGGITADLVSDDAWSSLASASTTNIGNVNSRNILITGNTTITSFGNTGGEGRYRLLRFSGVLTLTYDATTLILPGFANITTAAGDVAFAVKDSTANGYWRIAFYQPANGNPVKASIIPQNSQSADYTLVYSDGGKHIYHPSADTTPRTFTIPANGSVAFEIGTAVTFVNDSSAGTITIAINTDTLMQAGTGSTGSRTLLATGIATAVKITSTKWIISGTGLN